DVRVYHDLVQANQEHLERHDGWQGEIEATLDHLVARFTEKSPGDVRFGLRLRESLIGQVTLVRFEPPRWGLGYWLAHRMTGRGYMTASLRAVLEHARNDLAANE